MVYICLYAVVGDVRHGLEPMPEIETLHPGPKCSLSVLSPTQIFTAYRPAHQHSSPIIVILHGSRTAYSLTSTVRWARRSYRVPLTSRLTRIESPPHPKSCVRLSNACRVVGGRTSGWSQRAANRDGQANNGRRAGALDHAS
jgi:hypothetical protein